MHTWSIKVAVEVKYERKAIRKTKILRLETKLIEMNVNGQHSQITTDAV